MVVVARQVPRCEVSPATAHRAFIADFACYSHRLIVEIDGLTHDGREQYDEERDEWFRQRGWHVLRATDDEVLENLDGVVAAILIALRKAAESGARDY